MNPTTTVGEAVAQARTHLFPFDAPVVGVRRLLAIALGVPINTLNTDFPIPISAVAAGQNYVVRDVQVNNAQINNSGTITNSVTTATGGLFTAAAGGGTALVANAALSALTALTGAGGNLQMTVATTNFMATQTANPTLFWRTGTAQGAATSATVDVAIYGEVCP